METQLTIDEIKAKQQLLQDYEPEQKALAVLQTTVVWKLVLMLCGRKNSAKQTMERANLFCS